MPADGPLPEAVERRPLQRSPGSAFAGYQAGRGVGSPSGSGRAGSSVVSSLSRSLVATLRRCNPAFTYSSILTPRRVLTKPADPGEPGSHDNANSDLIVAVGDVFVSTLGSEYEVRDLLGQGTFGQVFKCVAREGREEVAIKVIKNQPAYYHQARVEVGVLQLLNTRADPGDEHHIVRMKDFFLFRNHLCLVFELLHLNLYELIRHNKFRGLSLPLVRVFVGQILDALCVLRGSRIIHCDLKPENVLLQSAESGAIKVIDFGSACFDTRTVYSYIQSRFYRSPEVVVGCPYTMAIDMWSLGCMAAELFLGLPLFPGACEHDLLTRMAAALGDLPDSLLATGKNTGKYYDKVGEGGGSSAAAARVGGARSAGRRYALRSREAMEAATGQAHPRGKVYFQHSALADIVSAYPFRPGLGDADVARERRYRESFTDFLLGVLDPDPATRWTPRQALQHPFVTGDPLTGPFQPPPDRDAGGAAARPQQQQQYAGGGGGGGMQASPSAAGIPMMIPDSRQRAQQATGLAPWAGSGAGSLPGVAMVASSPQAHAQAHAAAVAAVQAQMSIRQGQGVAGMSLTGGTYNPAHSLSHILPSLAAAHGYAAGGGLQHTPVGPSSLQAPLLSPPSRSFGAQLHFMDASLGGMDSGLGGARGVLPTLQASGGVAGADFSPMSFQPSSVSTYRAALAAAHVALGQQQQQQQQQAAAAAAVQQAVQQQQVQAAQAAAAQAAAAAGGGPYSAAEALALHQAQIQAQVHVQMQAHMQAYVQQTQQVQLAQQAQQLQQAVAQQSWVGSLGAAMGWTGAAAGVAAAPALAPAAGGSSRWTSMDGSLDGTPSGGQGLLASTATEDAADLPNPSDWDPLWSDDLLREEQAVREEDGGSERQRQQGSGSPGHSGGAPVDGAPASTRRRGSPAVRGGGPAAGRGQSTGPGWAQQRDAAGHAGPPSAEGRDSLSLASQYLSQLQRLQQQLPEQRQQQRDLNPASASGTQPGYAAGAGGPAGGSGRSSLETTRQPHASAPKAYGSPLPLPPGGSADQREVETPLDPALLLDQAAGSAMLWSPAVPHHGLTAEQALRQQPQNLPRQRQQGFDPK